MAKASLSFVCSDCGETYSKWQGQCLSCKQWNTVTEFRQSKAPKSAQVQYSGFSGQLSTQVQRLSEVSLDEHSRFSTGISEFDRVLGGGLVAGSVVLVGGHPGAGKSTLLLQTVCEMAGSYPVLYVTGEESLQQVALRASRLGLPTEQVNIISETNVQAICDLAAERRPKVLVIDSIQVMHAPETESAPGSVSQVRESAAWLTRFAKQTGTAIFLVGHVTKDGSLAGPKVLEHMIDCSIMLESASDSRYRTLRGIKNRFGAVNELGVFAMVNAGLKEVKNPSAIFLNRSQESAPGTLVTLVWEGTRPLLIELQALVDSSSLGNPRRISVGLDTNRLVMLLAVLNRHAGIFTGDQDVFLNMVGGIRVNETAPDLATLLAIQSSLRDKPLPRQMVAFGEVGLSGEIRPVPNGLERYKEAVKHGFNQIVMPTANAPKKADAGISVIAVDTLQQAMDAIS